MNEPGSQLPPSADELFRLLIDSVADYALILLIPKERLLVGTEVANVYSDINRMKS